MADRAVLTPNRITGAAPGGTRPRLTWSFSFPLAFRDARVVVVIYHLGLYARGALYAREKRDGTGGRGHFFQFRNPDPAANVLDDDKIKTGDLALGSVLLPQVRQGVLLVIGGALEHVGQNERSGWWVRPIGVRESKQPAFTIVDFHMPSVLEKDGKRKFISVDSRAAGRIVIPDDGFQNMWKDHPIALRMAVLKAPPGLPSLKRGSVIASSLCRDHNPAWNGDVNTLQHTADPDVTKTAFVLLTASGAQAGRPPKIGGPDTPSPPAPPRVAERMLEPDLTGLYEATNAEEPSLRLHLNQGGHALVGWFSRPRGFYDPAPAVDNLPPRPGCVVIEDLERPPDDKGRQFQWAMQKTNTSRNLVDPDRVLPFHGSGGPPRGTGLLKVIDDSPTPVLELVFEHPGGERTPAIRFKRVSATARWPMSVLTNPALFPDPEEREAVIAEQVEPVPQRAWTRMSELLAGDAVVAEGMTLRDVVALWQSTSNAAIKAAARASASNHLRNILSPFKGLNVKHLPRAVTRLHVFARERKITVDGVEQSTLRWLEQMVEQLMDALVRKRDNGDEALKKPNGQMPTDQELYETFVEIGFREARIGAGGRFRYILEFQSLGAPVPVVTAEGFLVTIRRQVRKAVQGNVVFEDDTVFGKTQLSGFVLGLGLGLSLKIKKDGVEAKVGKGSGVPGKAVFDSFVDAQLADFKGAWFSYSALDIGKGGGALPVPVPGVPKPGFKFHLVKSSLMHIYLRNGFDLIAIVDEPREIQVEKDAGAGIKAFELSTVWGRFSNDDKARRPEPPPPPEDSGKTVGKDVPAWAPVQFSLDSSEILAPERLILERRLAMNRAFFEMNAAEGKAMGFASPEGSELHNDNLSRARAGAVKQATRDAFPEQLACKIEAKGFGEKFARTQILEFQVGNGIQTFAPMLDPPGKTDAERERIREEETRYPIWRTVDLYISAHLVARVKSTGEQKGGGS